MSLSNFRLTREIGFRKYFGVRTRTIKLSIYSWDPSFGISTKKAHESVSNGMVFMKLFL